MVICLTYCKNKVKICVEYLFVGVENVVSFKIVMPVMVIQCTTILAHCLAFIEYLVTTLSLKLLIK